MGLNDFSFYDLICRNSHVYEHNAAWFEVDTQQDTEASGTWATKAISSAMSRGATPRRRPASTVTS